MPPGWGSPVFYGSVHIYFCYYTGKKKTEIMKYVHLRQVHRHVFRISWNIHTHVRQAFLSFTCALKTCLRANQLSRPLCRPSPRAEWWHILWAAKTHTKRCRPQAEKKKQPAVFLSVTSTEERPTFPLINYMNRMWHSACLHCPSYVLSQCLFFLSRQVEFCLNRLDSLGWQQCLRERITQATKMYKRFAMFFCSQAIWS